MASAPCRRPVAVAPRTLRPVTTISLEDVIQSVEVLADLEALCAEKMLIRYLDENSIERFCPTELLK